MELSRVFYKGTNPIPKGCTLMTQDFPQVPPPNAIMLGISTYEFWGTHIQTVAVILCWVVCFWLTGKRCERTWRVLL